jgi:hypothetical protein
VASAIVTGVGLVLTAGRSGTSFVSGGRASALAVVATAHSGPPLGQTQPPPASIAAIVTDFTAAQPLQADGQLGNRGFHHFREPARAHCAARARVLDRALS